MASMLPGLVAAVVWAQLISAPRLPPRLLDGLVGRAVNAEARALAARRGIRLTRPLDVRLVDGPHLAAARDAQRAAALPAPELARDQAALYARMGLASPVGQGDAAAGSSASSTEVTGLYDVGAGRLLVANWIDLQDGRFTRLRDIAQALLDRRFHLEAWFEPPTSRPARRPRTSGDASLDAALARQALVAGDATAQALEQMDPGGALPPPRALAQVIEQVSDALTEESGRAGASGLELARRLFIELDGLTFVAEARARAPWSAVNAIWTRPPQSTSQILHPQKYVRREAPDDVGARLPDTLGGAKAGPWQAVHGDSLGEWGVRLWLTPAVGDYRAARAATGLAGDRAVLFRGGTAAGTDEGRPEFAAWMTTWDDPTDAEDFAAQAVLALGGGALSEGVAARSGPEDRGGGGGGDERGGATPARWRLANAAGRIFALERRGATVGVLFGAPPDAEGLLSPLMKAAAAGGRRRGRARQSVAGRGRPR